MHEEARAILEDLHACEDSQYVSPLWLVWLYIGLGEKEHALDALAEAIAERSAYLWIIRQSAFFDPLRSDPRFAELASQVGSGVVGTNYDLAQEGWKGGPEAASVLFWPPCGQPGPHPSTSSSSANVARGAIPSPSPHRDRSAARHEVGECHGGSYIRKYILLEYEWNAHKSATNLAERGFDFAFASLIFEGKILEKVDDRRDYGEERFVAIGKADGITLTLVYTDRVAKVGRPVRRIISARRSNSNERKRYRRNTHQ